MRAIQPAGPYRIAGWSFGGLLAYEVGAQLVRVGEKVEFIGILDTSYVARKKAFIDAYRAEFNDRKELLSAIRAFMGQMLSEEEQNQANTGINSGRATEDFGALVEKLREMSLLPSIWVGLTADQLRQSLARIHSYKVATVRYCAPAIATQVHVFHAQDEDTNAPSLKTTALHFDE